MFKIIIYRLHKSVNWNQTSLLMKFLVFAILQPFSQVTKSTMFPTGYRNTMVSIMFMKMFTGTTLISSNMPRVQAFRLETIKLGQVNLKWKDHHLHPPREAKKQLWVPQKLIKAAYYVKNYYKNEKYSQFGISIKNTEI